MSDPTQQYDAEDADPPALSFFPDPPPFYKHFTEENLARLKEAGHESTSGDDAIGKNLSMDQLLSLPIELRYLIPPEPPTADEEFHIFNEKARAKGIHVFEKNMEYIGDMLRLEGVFPEGWKYKPLPHEPMSTDAFAALSHQQKLYSCLRSLLLCYVKLLGIMASDPTSSTKAATLDDMLTLVTNMHALINEYRPHQARETLIDKMEAQVERKKREIEGVHKVAERVRGVLEGFTREAERLYQDDEVRAGEALAIQDAHAKNANMQRHMWEIMDEILGR